MTSLAAPLILVLGASGGLGASTWAGALARRMAVHLGTCVLVDGDVRGGGLDMTCGVEHVPGLRWPDLARLQGTTSCSRLVAALPCGEVPVLSAGGLGGTVPDAAVLDVVESLRGEVPVVMDAKVGTTVAETLVRTASGVSVLAGVRSRQLADAEALLSGLSGIETGLVTRGDRALTPELSEVVDRLGVPHRAHLRDDVRVRRDGERGDWPGRRGPLRDSADGVVLDLVQHRGRRAS